MSSVNTPSTAAFTPNPQFQFPSQLGIPDSAIMTILALLLLLAFRSSRYGLFLYLLKMVQMLRDYYHMAKCALCPLHAYAQKKT